MEQSPTYPRRIYPLSPRELTEEELAVVFAMTSRRPEPFDEIARQVSREKAAEFHERWVVGYGHASVAEHAVLHIAIENISRLVCDSLEDNRLASYTEKSSRFQVLPQDYFHIPKELDSHPLRGLYIQACSRLFQAYHRMVERTRAYLREVRPRQEGETEQAYNLRLRREATDSCRFILPAATLTQVGVTMNARSLEHAIRKLLSSGLVEERELGEELKAQGQRITPTLVKYAERNEYLVLTRKAQEETAPRAAREEETGATLVHYDPDAEKKLVAALLYRFSDLPYEELWRRVQGMGPEERERVVEEALGHLGPYDVPVRELEFVEYTFDLLMDYGAYREFKRHRMQSYIPQPLTVEHGYEVPELLVRAGLREEFEDAIREAEEAFRKVSSFSPQVARYLVTHAHRRRVLAKMNLRECYHIFKLRTSPQAHFSIRKVMEKALDEARKKHPLLFRYLRLRSEG